MRRAFWIAAALVAVGVPLLHPNSYVLDVIAKAYITAIAVYGLNVILGYTGLLNLGHAAFFAIGAYGVALLEKNAGWPFWPALLAGCLGSVVLGFFVGIISLRTRGNYFAIFTAAIGVMISIVITNADKITGGNVGIVAIPPPPNIGPVSFADDVPKYYLVLAILVFAVAICALVRNSLVGRTFVAIADNEDLARATGVDVPRTKLVAFMLSTFLAGLAGGVYAAYVGFLGPDQSGLDVTFQQLLFLVVGGIGTISGPLLGTLLLEGVSQWLQGVQQYRFIIFGPLLVVLVIFFPHGIAGGLARLQHRVAPRGPTPSARTANAPEATAS
jgi:branched-chain amino acid transport system permease protein